MPDLYSGKVRLNTLKVNLKTFMTYQMPLRAVIVTEHYKIVMFKNIVELKNTGPFDASVLK